MGAYMAFQIQAVTGSCGVRAALNLYFDDADRERGWSPGQPPIQHREAELESKADTFPAACSAPCSAKSVPKGEFP